MATKPATTSRLESWKAIARYLDRDTSTVRRWEKREGLPVHRHVHERQATVYAFPSELDAWLDSRRPATRPASHAGEVWLAVLPLDNLTGERAHDYLVQGIHDALLAGLSRISALKIIARRSVARYAGTDQAMSAIAGELGVQALIEGSVMRVDDRVRVSVQLIDGASEEHLWAESYERDVNDVIALQSELARMIASAVHVTLTPQEQRRLTGGSSVTPEAYDAYLKGRFHWAKLSADQLDTAFEYFRLALSLDTRCAQAHVGLADVWFSRGEFGLTPPSEAFPRMKASVLDALALDEGLAEAHGTLGNVRFVHDWDMPSAERAFRRALELNPNYADGHFFYADFLISLARFDEAAPRLARALQLDPFNTLYHCFRGWHLLYRGLVDEAVPVLRGVLRTHPAFPAAMQGLWGAHYLRQETDEALRAARDFFILIERPEIARRLRGSDYRSAMHAAADALASRAVETYVGAVRIARLYAHAGVTGEALSWLERAFAEREPALVHLGVSWDWRNLRGDVRYRDLLRRMHLDQG